MNKDDAEKFHALCAARTENAILRKENSELRKEVADLKERWSKTHEPSELRVRLARALEEIAILKSVNYDTGEIYSKALSQKL